MSNLPSLENVTFDAQGLSAYGFLLKAEKAALSCGGKSPAKYMDELIGVRVLGFLLKEFWDRKLFETIPYKRIVCEVVSCLMVANAGLNVGSAEEEQAQFEKVYELGLSYRNNLMHAFLSNAGPSPTHSRHSDTSRPSFGKYKEAIIESMAHAPISKSNVKLQALIRDGHRCMITGLYDYVSVENYPDIRTSNHSLAETECAHSFSESTQDTVTAATGFTALKMFGLDCAVMDLLGGKVNNLKNVLTMVAALRTAFDRFDFWLEKVEGESNTYNVCAAHEIFSQRVECPPRRVTFRIDPSTVSECTAKKQPIPALPDPDLIALRAVCARVSHMSGAAEQRDQIIRDREEMEVLAKDGSEGYVLDALLKASLTEVEMVEA